MKQKTRKSVSKRFKLTNTGKLMRRMSGGRHIRRTKSSKQKRNYRKLHELTNKRIARRVKRLIAVA